MKFTDQAIILKRYNLGEADRLITFLTRNHGKFTAVAKGVRKLTSRKGGNLELFNNIQGFFVETRGLSLITEVFLFSSFEQIKKDLEKVGQAWYVCELVDCLLREGQETYQVFNLLLGILRKMNDLRVDLRSMNYELRNFEVRLLKILGFWSDEVHGQKYPQDPVLQARFNRALISQILERSLKTPKFLEKISLSTQEKIF